MQDPPQQSASQPFTFARLLPVVILIGLFVLAFSMGWHKYLSFEALRDNREWLSQQLINYGAIAHVGFIVIYAVATAASVPGGVFLTLAGGFLFGTWLASLYVVLGATIGATAIFLAARTALGDVLKRRAGPALQKMEAGFRENQLSYLLVLRLIPLFPFWLVNLVPAFVGMSLRNYLIGTVLGIIPGTVVYCSVGSGLSAIFEAGETPDLGIIFQPRIMLPILGLALLSLLPVIYKKMKARRP